MVDRIRSYEDRDRLDIVKRWSIVASGLERGRSSSRNRVAPPEAGRRGWHLRRGSSGRIARFGRTKPIGYAQIECQCWSRPWVNESGGSQPVEASATSRLRQTFDPAQRVDMIESSRDRPRSVGHRRDRNPKTIQWTWWRWRGRGRWRWRGRGRGGVQESSQESEEREMQIM
jgi:hypothetical protein